MIQVALNHRTVYRYEKPVSLGPQVVRLRPAPQCRIPILNYSLKIGPDEHVLHWQRDLYGNLVARVVFPEKTEQFEVQVDLTAELPAINPFDYFLEPAAEEYPFEYPADLAKDLEPYRVLDGKGPLLDAFLSNVSRERRPTVGFLVDLNRRVRDRIGYVVRLDPGIQTCEETLERRTGSCRDSGWLLVQVLRHLGLAARFVSGYLIQLASDEPETEESLREVADHVELHAWAEVYLPGAGWIGFDPTSGLLTAESHIPLACTPDPSKAAPITGSVEPSKVDFSYSMSVRRLNETPRLTRPYTDDQWRRIQDLGHTVDADLNERDVRLTMGGEPTFVGIDEPESPEWNLEALGPLKRIRAATLIRRIQERIAPGALLHFGQGKWYPGESLPRWALSCFWRIDGIPVWENTRLIAENDRNYEFNQSDALEFMEALTRRLQVASKNILPAYEDGEPAGYVLPLRRRHHKGRLYWSSQLWFPRPERLLLLPGDSPVGYRLPVDSVPWVVPDTIDISDREDLPRRVSRIDLFDTDAEDDPLPAASNDRETSQQTVRPALCIEARDGRLHVFLPYTPRLPDYLDLIAAVEDTSLHLNKPAWIEGYTPPLDPRIRSFSVTPDPGVLEVNLPPASTWDELEQLNSLVFEEARRARLVAEKFLYDGKHVATGGGNHIVIGGPTVADSPLLRRPDLLRSMLTFWQNHPSLSYLFSGTFIGPTSQYPRVDEARMDALYELEIAFSQMPAGEFPPSLVDGLFRNLLVDLTGNTHRAEFCIDKLYPPSGAGFQLGLLELRAFEMAPHVRMELTELLLIRALVATFWHRPYRGALVRWGTALHDRFLLPHFVKQDFIEVLAFLERSGYKFDEQWFAPHQEFRFPTIGSVDVDDMRLELRQALEPWHVLGEEASSGGTSRTVDSSSERLQVKISGLIPSRFAVACNGRRVPPQATGRPGEAVAGIRFRAWQPALCLHPTIPVHSPLIFDVVDLWNERSIGGCRYHVLRPGGQLYETRPVSASEAELRRAERFQNFGHTAGPMVLPCEDLNPCFPMTLDLRWPVRAETGPTDAAGLVS